MGTAPCYSKVALHKGRWTSEEDTLLIKYMEAHGEGRWRSLPEKAGLLRCEQELQAKMDELPKTNIRKGNIKPDDDDLIIRLHLLLGNHWSLIAGRLPGRTDNEIENHWNNHLSRRLLSEGVDSNTQKELSHPPASIVNKRKKQNYNTENLVLSAKPKVYFLKPTRVTSTVNLPGNDNFNAASTGCTAISSTQDQVSDHVNNIPASDIKEGRTVFFIGDGATRLKEYLTFHLVMLIAY